MYDLIINFIADLLSNGVSHQAKRIRDLLMQSNVRFAILGYRSCGKTTLKNRMLGVPLKVDQPATVGEERIGSFEYVSITQTVSVEKFSDFGGELSYWPLWDDAFTRDRPKGIIFMIDHEHLSEHTEAFKFFVDFISKNDTRWLFFKGRHVKAREQLKIIMFLVNKEDKWGRSQSMEDFLLHFSEEFDRIKTLQIPLVLYSCSVLHGTNVDVALSDFFRRML